MEEHEEIFIEVGDSFLKICEDMAKTPPKITIAGTELMVMNGVRHAGMEAIHRQLFQDHRIPSAKEDKTNDWSIVRGKIDDKKSKPGVGEYTGVFKDKTVQKLGSNKKATRTTRDRLI